LDASVAADHGEQQTDAQHVSGGRGTTGYWQWSATLAARPWRGWKLLRLPTAKLTAGSAVGGGALERWWIRVVTITDSQPAAGRHSVLDRTGRCDADPVEDPRRPGPATQWQEVVRSRVQVDPAPADGLAWTSAGLRVALPPPAPDPPMPLPQGLRPMLAVTTATLPAETEAWAAEIKWDGYRALCLHDHQGMRLQSRRGTDMAPWFPELAGLHRALDGREVVLDGEVVALGADGRPAFQQLQRRMRGRPVGPPRRPVGDPVVLMVFDLLWLDGRPVTGLPYLERRRLLEQLGLAGPSWQTTTVFPGQAAELLAASRQQGLEGIVVKRGGSPYRPGRRSGDWRKLLNYQQEVFLVGGYVPGPNGPAALLVGSPDPTTGRLRYAGRVDHGLLPAARRRLAELLAEQTTPTSPFQTPRLAGGRWGQRQAPEPALVFVRPQLAVQVRFLGWEAGRLRHPTYRGLA
jgi:bifunctional non-homologous end joining protein LigD